MPTFLRADGQDTIGTVASVAVSHSLRLWNLAKVGLILRGTKALYIVPSVVSRLRRGTQLKTPTWESKFSFLKITH